MFLIVAVVLLAAWLLGITWLYPHKPVHVLLLGGLMFLLLGVLERLDAARFGGHNDHLKKP